MSRSGTLSTVYVVDDDPSVRRALSRRLELAGFQVHAFASAASFLAHPRTDSPSCAVVDLRMPALDGLALQEQLAAQDDPMPLIFLTAYGDVRSSVRAMKRGAIDFLGKPVSGTELVRAIVTALAHDKQARLQRTRARQARTAYATLTRRQREVFGLITRGLLNKQIAASLGTSERTVKAHRAEIMRKMRAESLADLVRSAEWLGVDGASADSASPVR